MEPNDFEPNPLTVRQQNKILASSIYFSQVFCHRDGNLTDTSGNRETEDLYT
jgi:hypothetical protein